MHGAQTTTAVVFSSAFVTRSSASATRLEHYFFSRWVFFWSRLFCEEALKGPFFFFFRFFCLSLVFFVKKKTPAFSFSPKKKRISSRPDLCLRRRRRLRGRLRRRRIAPPESVPPPEQKALSHGADDVCDGARTKGCGNGQLLGRVLAGCGRRKRTENERREQGAF